MTLYGNIREICKEKKVAVTHLEESLGFAKGSICKWDDNIPSVARVSQVAEALGVSINRILRDVTF